MEQIDLKTFNRVNKYIMTKTNFLVWNTVWNSLRIQIWVSVYDRLRNPIQSWIKEQNK